VEPGISLSIPGVGALDLRHLVLDLNGTLTERGELQPGVGHGLLGLAGRLGIHIVSADTYGTLSVIAERLEARWKRVATGAEKVAYLEELGAASCAMVGNGRNDVGALRRAGLGICVVGPEGAASEAIGAADIVVTSVADAISLLSDPTQIVATLRS
jgi:soluble P-type ATPase